MPGLIKYSTSDVDESLRKGNTAIAVGDVPSSVVSTMNSTMDIPIGGYAVYSIGSNNNPKMWTANTGGDLLPIARTLGGNPTTVEDAIYYICSVTDAWIVNNPVNDIVTNGLIMKLHASNLSSYPGINSSFMDISGDGNNSTLTNGPTFNSNGFLELDGVDDYIDLPSSIATALNGLDEASVCILLKLNSNSNGVGDTGIIQLSNYNSSNGNLYFYSNGYTYLSIFRTNRVSQVFANSSVVGTDWHMLTVTTTPGTNGWKCYINSTLKKEVDGLSTVSVNDSIQGGLTLGRNSNSRYTYGDIASCLIYDRALTVEEIEQNYHQAPIVTEDLYFSIDAGNLISFENGSTAVNSLVGSTNGTLAGAVYNEFSGGCWEFGSNRNTYLKAGGNPGPFDFPGWDGYTVNIWVKRTAFGTWQSGGTTNYDGIWNYYWNHNLSFTGAHTGVNRIQGTGISGGYDIEMDTWYNVIMTHDNGSSVGNHKVYINGELEYTANVSNATYSSGNNRQFFIGNWDSGWSMVGEIGMLQVYDRHLTGAEALQNYNATKNRFENLAPNPIETDGDYLKVFRQDSSNGAFFSSANSWAEARRTNDDNPQADKYSILNTVENYKLNGKYTFKLTYPKLGLHNIWSQRNNPVNDPGTGGVDSYIGIDIQMTSNGWGGLERYDPQNSTFLDGTLVPQGNWYYAIGSKSWSSSTTFPGYNAPVDEVELWIKYK